MPEGKSYVGWLLAAHPKYPDDILKKSVILITAHGVEGTVGLIVNRPMTNGMDFNNVMRNAGIDVDIDEPLYSGGLDAPHRVFMLHSVDWSSPTTTMVTDSIAFSKDVTVLSAIAANVGPEQYRACAGYISWAPGQLEGEISGRTPWTPSHSWIGIPGTAELLFNVEPHEQWARVIERASQMQVQNWFNLFLD